jgi:hypothetical protein
MGLNGYLDYEIFHESFNGRQVPSICTTVVAEDESSPRASIRPYSLVRARVTGKGGG